MDHYIIHDSGVHIETPNIIVRLVGWLSDIFDRSGTTQYDIVLGKGTYSKRGPIVHGRGRYFYLTRNVRCRNFTLQEGYVLYTLGNKITASESYTNDGRILEKPIKPYSA